MDDNINNSLAQNKVLILYTLNTVGKDITGSGLFKIISAVNDINYFYFKQLLVDLVDSKLVGTYTKDESTVYEITSDGKRKVSEIGNEVMLADNDLGCIKNVMSFSW